MTIALISTNPVSFIEAWPSGPVNVNITGTLQAYSVDAGWVSPNGAYQLVTVPPFIPPSGQQITGEPSYSIVDGAVVENYATEAIPVAPAPQITSISRRQFFQQLAAQGIITQAESITALTGTLPPEITTVISALPADDQYPATMLLLGATAINLTDPMTVVFATAYGWTTDQTGAFFNAAGAL